jgi:hypothetical protein
LLETPEKFAGKRVDVRGYHRTGTEDSCLIECENCAQSPDPTEKSVWLDPLVWDPRYYPRRPRQVAKSDDVDNRMIRVIGIFHYEPRPILGKDVPYEFRYRGFGCYKMWSREIADITYIQPLR